jgi:tRNA threonylcarbamoyladenosine biosynthesis protein TsaB
MTYLAIETSDPRGSLALFDESERVDEARFPDGLVHAREFAVRLEELLGARGLVPGDLVGVAVSIGPGSYTGCRVGVTAAKSLSFALGLPVLEVSSLEVMAALAIAEPRTSRGEWPEDAAFSPVLDGRRGFFYGACFEADENGRPRRKSEDQVGDRSVIEGAMRRPSIVFGDGADAFLAGGVAEETDGLVRGPTAWDAPRAKVLAELARPRMGEAHVDAETIHALAPAYLRPSEPEIVYERRKAERDAGTDAGQRTDGGGR